MTTEEKVTMLKKAGVWDVIGFPSCIDKLIDLVAANEKKFWMAQIEVECNEAVLAEREACAKVVEAGVLGHGECAAAVRARGEK